MTSLRARRPALPGTLVATALTGVALALPGVAAASPATVTLQGMEPGYGPVTIPTTGGGRVSAKLGWFRLSVAAPAAPAVTVRGYCDDPLTAIAPNRAYTVDLRTADESADLGTPGYSGVSWLLRSSERLITAAPNPGREAAAIQVAVWKLGGRVPATARSGDSALDARVEQLRTLALTAHTPRTPGATAAADASACAGTGTVRVDIAGAPGAVARVAVPAPATVSASTVVLGMDGTAHVDVRSATPAAVTVHVALEGGDLVRAARPAGASGPQETVFVRPAAAQADVPVAFRDCTPTPAPTPTPGGGGTTPGPTTTPSTPDGGPATPGTPTQGTSTPEVVVPAAPVTPLGTDVPAATTPKDTPSGGGTPPQGLQAPRLAVRKIATARVRLGGRIHYAITLRNRGAVALTGLTVRDRLPERTFLAGTPAGSRLEAGALVWDLGRLAPGEARTLRLVVRVPSDRAGRVCNIATAVADGGARGSGRACTVVVGRPRAVIPSVTG